jgi:hypothetical protein
MMQLMILLALLGCVVLAAATPAPAARQVVSTVGGRNDPEVNVRQRSMELRL